MQDEQSLTTRQQEIVEAIRRLRDAHGYPPSIREIGEAVGLTSTSSVHSQLTSLTKKGIVRRDPTKPRAIHLNDGWEGSGAQRAPLAYVPVYGQIAAGAPIVADNQVNQPEELLPLPAPNLGQGDLFAVRVRGDSMIEAGILDGDYVIVRQQENAESGDLVAALVGDADAEGGATVKRLSRKDGRVVLLPANPAYEPIDITEDMGSDGPSKLLGRVVAVFRDRP